MGREAKRRAPLNICRAPPRRSGASNVVRNPGIWRTRVLRVESCVVMRTAATLAANDEGSTEDMTEREFSTRFRQHMPLVPAGDSHRRSCLIVPELDGPVRRADFAQVDWLTGRSPDHAEIASLACFRSIVAVRLYRMLSDEKRRPLPHLCSAVGFGRDTVRQHLNSLQEHRWVVELGDGCFRRNWRRSVPRFHLTTYELKLSDWRTACTQLTGHMLYADRAVLVMPRPRLSSTARRIAEGLSTYPASLVFVDGNTPLVEAWRDVPWTQADYRLCALGKACAQHAGT